MSQIINHTLAAVKGLRWQQSRLISTTGTLYAEPPRKRRRIDPAVLKARVEKKIKKVERQISKLQAEPRQLIPILEYQLNNSEIRDLRSRPQHKLEDFGLTEGSLKAAQRLWNFYRREQNVMERRSVQRVERAQAKALEQLKSLDKELYDRTVAVDETILIPYRSSHMRKETGSNAEYAPPDGYVKDISKEWVM